MSKHESEVLTLLQNIVTKPVAIKSIEVCMTMVKDNF